MRCRQCRAELSANDTVRYVETYRARIGDRELSKVTVEPHSDSIESFAFCAKCGASVDYQDVDFMS